MSYARGVVVIRDASRDGFCKVLHYLFNMYYVRHPIDVAQMRNLYFQCASLSSKY